MTSTRATSIAVGSLFIVATVSYLVGQALYRPLLEAPDFLAVIEPQRTRFLTGVFVELVGILAIPLIAAFAFPVVKRYSEGVAASYLALRVIEAMLLLVVVVNVLTVADMSRSYLGGEVIPNTDWESLAASLQRSGEWPFLLSVAVVFPLGSLFLNAVLFRARLVPRFIAAWGLFGAALLLSGSLLDMLGALGDISPTAVEIILATPIAIQEMVLAFWLIVRGFDVLARAGTEAHSDARPRPA